MQISFKEKFEYHGATTIITFNDYKQIVNYKEFLKIEHFVNYLQEYANSNSNMKLQNLLENAMVILAEKDFVYFVEIFDEIYQSMSENKQYNIREHCIPFALMNIYAINFELSENFKFLARKYTDIYKYSKIVHTLGKKCFEVFGIVCVKFIGDGLTASELKFKKMMKVQSCSEFAKIFGLYHCLTYSIFADFEIYNKIFEQMQNLFKNQKESEKLKLSKDLEIFVNKFAKDESFEISYILQTDESFETDDVLCEFTVKRANTSSHTVTVDAEYKATRFEPIMSNISICVYHFDNFELLTEIFGNSLKIENLLN
jgi:hypothetical protein